MKPVKQVTVMRHDLKMRAGKQISQGQHVTMMFLLDNYGRPLSKVEIQWLSQGMPKIVCRVESEAELLEIFGKATAANLTVFMVTDAGRTEFHGVPTRTCLAIGPNYEEDIDLITGELKLL